MLVWGNGYQQGGFLLRCTCRLMTRESFFYNFECQDRISETMLKCVENNEEKSKGYQSNCVSTYGNRTNRNTHHKYINQQHTRNEPLFCWSCCFSSRCCNTKSKVTTELASWFYLHLRSVLCLLEITALNNTYNVTMHENRMNIMSHFVETFLSCTASILRPK